MLSIIGAILVFVSGTLIGFYVSAQYANRPKQIRQLMQALQRLETEISYGMTPLPEALSGIAGQMAQPLSSLLLATAQQLEHDSVHTAQAWETAVGQWWGRTALGDAEKEIVLHLGRTMGASDRDDQTKHLRLAMSQLKAAEDAATEDQRQYAKMWKSLGMLGSALIIILMY